MTRWADILIVFAGLMGAAGVGLAALGAHGGGDPRLTTAAMFLLLHAGALVGMRPMLNPAASMRATFLASATALCFGTILFSADLALRSLAGMAAFAFAAPAGGMLMIAGWAVLAGAAIFVAASRPAS